MSYSAMKRAQPVAAEAATLVDRYPDLNAAELKRLIEIFPRLPILEVGLMTSDPNLTTKLDDFYKEHGRRMRHPISGLVVFLAVPVTFLIALAWALLTWS